MSYDLDDCSNCDHLKREITRLKADNADLLAACEDAANTLAIEGRNDPPNSALNMTLKAVRLAIAKAKGTT